MFRKAMGLIVLLYGIAMLVFAIQSPPTGESTLFMVGYFAGIAGAIVAGIMILSWSNRKED